ncbi:S1 family peptidase [Xanthobacter oligotrophicus]|uniref:S1 family peptidase n=1 Tax=Xanthobacter oligotrophicus TaxID=2607286 RepID=UPI00165EB3A1|nr:serine protease [Xanthobacter oligotrophicus]
MMMKVWSWLLVACFFACAAPKTVVARTLSLPSVAGWDVWASFNDKTKAFENCSALATYRSGVGLIFMLDSNFGWLIGLIGGSIRATEGVNYDFIFKIDDGRVYNYRSIGVGNNFMAVKLADSVDLFNEMRRGRVLYTKAGNEFVQFRLDGSARMLGSLVECVKNKGRVDQIPPTSTQAPPSAARPAASSGSNPAPRGGVQTGSGFFISSRGEGITNAHVVDGCRSAVISGFGPAKIIARDTTNDLALLQIAGESKTPFARLRRKSLQLGETVYVMGFPLAGHLDNGLNFTSGLVSSLAGMGNDSRLLQFTAPIQPGNSGGPVVDNAGLVVGVIQSKLDEVAALKESGSLPQNINFGVKVGLLVNFIQANGSSLVEVDSSPPIEATAVATDGRGFTFQVKCTTE